MSNPPNVFVSVKLTATLVNQAREASQTMRRSIASQIEYWATLGKALESAGLTTSDSHALIARQERATYHVTTPVPPPVALELEDLQAHVLALAKSGALSARAEEAVVANKTRGRPRTRKAA